MVRFSIILLSILSAMGNLTAQNPIVKNMGVNDPHIHIFNNRAYLYATHDRSIKDTSFLMEDWWVWSSDNLVEWRLESTLKPEQTYLGKGFNQCWATDAATKDGKYYWYFSEANRQTGVVVGDSPVGPWRDPLNKPLLNSELTPTHEYDMCVFKEDDGSHHILFGVWDYYMSPLAEDMISLSEKPRKITINNPVGPYGVGTTDDKPFLHKYKNKYYLSWGCFYAVSDSLYGPYDYVGTVINAKSFAPGYDSPTWPNGFLQGRHGSFFEWNNQWYYAYCDISQTGNRYFRDTFISYVHYKANGEIAPIRVDGIGVGRYDADRAIEAEEYFKAEGIEKREMFDNNFCVSEIDNNDFLLFPNIYNLKNKKSIELHLAQTKPATSVIEIRKDKSDGELLTTINMSGNQGNIVSVPITFKEDKISICFVFKGESPKLFSFDKFIFK